MSPATSNVIIFVKRSEVRDLVKLALKAQNFKSDSFINVMSGKEFMSALLQTPAAICILDWQLGIENLTYCATRLRSEGKIESHPVLLLSASDEKRIQNFAKEYLIFKILQGDLSLDLIRKSLVSVAKYCMDTNPIRSELLEAGKAQQNGESEKALMILQGLHEKYPESTRLHAELGEILSHLNRWDEVKDCLKPLVDNQVTSPRILHLYARSLFRTGERASAIEVMEKAKILNPHNLERLLELGSFLVQDNQAPKAAEVYQEAANLGPDSREATVGKAVCHLLVDEVNEALDLMRSKALSRELGAMFNLAGVVACHFQQFELSLKLYNAAIKHVQKFGNLTARIYFNLGLAYYKSEKIPDAIRMFDKALVLDPTLDRAASNRRALLTLQRRPESAVAASPKEADIFGADLDEEFEENEDIIVGTQDEIGLREMDNIIGRNAS